MKTKCLVANTLDLMKRYLDGKDALSNDEREILLFSLYIESKQRGGLAQQGWDALCKPVEPLRPSVRP